ncbi:MAG: peroxiredoxin [Myxococcota bacterium]|nr:peroxiredoxin [Myxococcota bacterium]
MTILVGKAAPDFTTQAVLANDAVDENFNFHSAIKGKYAVLFFYPLDFTFVCPTELISMDNRMDRFRELGAEVVGVSIDSHWTHKAWRNTPVDKGGVGQLQYTLAADMNHAISRAYGVENDGVNPNYPAGSAMRATFVIDTDGIVRHMVVNDEPLGRNMDEVVRIIEAWQNFEENGQVCPAGWDKDKASFKPHDFDILSAYLSENAQDL